MCNRKEALLNLKKVLERRRDALRRALAGDISALQELHELSGDMADGALDASKDAVNSQLVEIESQELAKVEAAMQKVRNDTYGQCENCKADIPMKRLTALPYAALCIKCQREAERENKIHVPVGDVDWSHLTGSDVEIDSLKAL